MNLTKIWVVSHMLADEAQIGSALAAHGIFSSERDKRIQAYFKELSELFETSKRRIPAGE